jgi:hypothetical protein
LNNSIIALTVITSLFIGAREMFGFRKIVRQAIIDLLEKVNDSSTTTEQMSPIETLVINLMKFRVFSFSKLFISKYLAKNEKLYIGNFGAGTVTIRNLSNAQEFIANPSSIQTAARGSTVSVEGSKVEPTNSPFHKPPQSDEHNLHAQLRKMSSYGQQPGRSFSQSISGVEDLGKGHPLENPGRAQSMSQQRNTQVDIDSDDE